jgi:hypothetical protein
LFFPLIYLWRRTRLLGLLIGIGLHLGIAMMFPHPWFAGLMLIFYVALLPEAWVTRQRLENTQWRYPLRVAVLLSILTAWVYIPNYVSYRPAQQVLKTVRKALAVATGIATHKVFEDSGFAHYEHQMRLTASGSSPDKSIPYSRDGLYAWSVWDRVWEFWLKRTQSPFVPIPQAELNLTRWASFYWPANTVLIEARPQTVELHGIDTGLFSKNRAAAWREIGFIDTRSRRITWLNPPTAGEPKLGDYLSRILAQ